ncbi:type II secretion system F family protein [Gymnodinialimonas ceratoperidinii]|uniref:Type II secretion system F family protein n=1 Tax=Gymnodinialimonas ceratoperidinii TaxID=2856823 RepID=A0A8F6Y8R0_9RHOB|nr:type II secretion system F family protein [Gymnodinialimonas ceratoperidinii]QXT38169.1 type II secretion system F family protein [Gymnodinialimonas ceratoperidinii]
MGLDILFLILGGVMLAAMVLGALIALDRRRRAHLERIERALPARQIAHTSAPSRRKSSASSAANATGVARLLGQLEAALRRAGLRLSVTECLAQVGIAVLILFAGLTLGLRQPPFLAALLAAIIPAIVLVLILRLSYARRIAAFTLLLPEALDVFARGLKAGRPVADSLAIVVENAPEPLRSEFAICHGQLTLGTGLADTFTDLAHRMPTPEANFFGVATSLQTETGGNLVDTIENLAQQLRDRRRLKQKARALSSEARASAVILASLPFGITGVIFVLNADYLSPLFFDPRGVKLLVAGLVGIIIGVLMMIRMGRLDV